MRIYHIARPEDWENSAENGEYAVESLESEGFIHCSFDEQLAGVLERYYKGAGEVLVLEIDPELLGPKLVIEPSTGGDLYPHIYGKINVDAVTGTRRIAAPPASDS